MLHEPIKRAHKIQTECDVIVPNNHNKCENTQLHRSSTCFNSFSFTCLWKKYALQEKEKGNSVRYGHDPRMINHFRKPVCNWPGNSVWEEVDRYIKQDDPKPNLTRPQLTQRPNQGSARDWARPRPTIELQLTLRLSSRIFPLVMV